MSSVERANSGDASNSTDLRSEADHNAASRESTEEPKKPSRMRKIWDKTGLDAPTLMSMAKAALAPTIALSIYQVDSVANIFTTLGYLVAIASLLSIPIMPRAKYIQTLMFNVIATCVGASISILACWTSIQARKHTTSPGASASGYNSSASAVCAIWLFFQVYLINAIKSARPQFIFPSILASIFAVVSMTYGPNFADMAAVYSFVRKLLIGFLTGFAIATGVSLFVFPVSSRTVIFKEMTGYFGGLRGILTAETKYVESIENHDMFREVLPEASTVKQEIAGLKALHGKVGQDLVFAKREVAWGKLDASDISEIYRLLREVLLPLIGMGSLIDILKTIGDGQGWTQHSASDDGQSEESLTDEQRTAVQDWQLLMRTLHTPFHDAREMMDDGLEHILLVLEFKKASKNRGGSGQSQMTDLEAKGGEIQPGDSEFYKSLEGRIEAFCHSREVTLQEWCRNKGVAVPSGSVADHVDWPSEIDENTKSRPRQRDQRQLFVLLYMEWLLLSASRAVLDMVRFADSKIADGTMKKKHLIVPGLKRLRKWAMSAFDSKGNPADHHFDGAEAQAADDLGTPEQGYRGRKDPEHLPPRNRWQKFGNSVRGIPHTLRSPHSVFGLRAACAVMSISIVAYLRTTHEFFLVQRLFWASIMTAISMGRLAGQATFGFSLRILGTFVAMCASFVVYYIVDGHTAGVLVFEFLWIFTSFYVVVKLPKYIMVGMICAITSILIIGYELQVQKIGVVVSESNYQAYYPIYELAPYRLACVAGGIFVAYFWTIFPYPISEHSEIRRDLGSAIHLLAKHHEIVLATIDLQLRGISGDPESKKSPGRALLKTRLQVFAQHNALIGRLRLNSGFHRWEFGLGGEFPKSIYDACITFTENCINYAALLGYAAKCFTPENESQHQWELDMLTLLKEIHTKSHGVTTRLCLLANCISTATALPPFLQPLEPFGLINQLQALDKEILGVRHITEPGYAAFAVMQIASRTMIIEINKLTDHVRDLVGELDFSFHTGPSPNSSADDISGKARKAD